MLLSVIAVVVLGWTNYFLTFCSENTVFGFLSIQLTSLYGKTWFRKNKNQGCPGRSCNHGALQVALQQDAYTTVVMRS